MVNTYRAESKTKQWQNKNIDELKGKQSMITQTVGTNNINNKDGDPSREFENRN